MSVRTNGIKGPEPRFYGVARHGPRTQSRLRRVLATGMHHGTHSGPAYRFVATFTMGGELAMRPAAKAQREFVVRIEGAGNDTDRFSEAYDRVAQTILTTTIDHMSEMDTNTPVDSEEQRMSQLVALDSELHRVSRIDANDRWEDVRLWIRESAYEKKQEGLLDEHAFELLDAVERSPSWDVFVSSASYMWALTAAREEKTFDSYHGVYYYNEPADVRTRGLHLWALYLAKAIGSVNVVITTDTATYVAENPEPSIALDRLYEANRPRVMWQPTQFVMDEED